MKELEFKRAYQGFICSRSWADLKSDFTKNADLFLSPEFSVFINGSENVHLDSHKYFFQIILSKVQYKGIDGAFADFLDPWMMDAISRELVVAISKAGDSSLLMFELFRHRHEILPVLHLCKPLKGTPLIQLITRIPEALIQSLINLELEQNNKVFIMRLLDYHTKEEFPGIYAELTNLINNDTYCLDFRHILKDYQSYFSISKAFENYQWAINQDHIGLLMKNRTVGNNDHNIMAAINLYENAVSGFQGGEYPRDWAIAKSNLGNAYLLRKDISEEEKMEVALKHFSDAISVIDPKSDPELWASANDNLSTAFGGLANIGDDRYIQMAISNSIQALENFKKAANHLEAIKVMINLANFYFLDLNQSKRTANLQMAAAYCEEALAVSTIYIPDDVKFQILSVLGDVLVRRSDKEGFVYAEKAIPYLQEAIQLYKEEKHKSRLIKVKLSISIAYHKLNRIEQALNMLQDTMESGKFHPSPRWHAETLAMRADLYGVRKAGDRVLNQIEAIRSYEDAIAIYQATSNLEKWATLETKLIPLMLNVQSGTSSSVVQRCFKRMDFILPLLDDYPKELSLIHGTIGLVYIYNYNVNHDTINLKKALENLNLGIRVHSQIESPGIWERLSFNIANVLALTPNAKQEEYENGLVICKELLKTGGKSDKELNISLLLTTGILYKYLIPCNFPNASENCLKYLQRARSLVTGDSGPDISYRVLKANGDFYCQTSQWQQAIGAFLDLDKYLLAYHSSMHGIWTNDLLVAQIGSIHELIAYCYSKLGNFRSAIDYSFSAGTRILNQIMRVKKRIALLDEPLKITAQMLFFHMQKWDEMFALDPSQMKTIGFENRLNREEIKRYMETIDNQWRENIPFDYHLSEEPPSTNDLIALIPENGGLVMPLISEHGTIIFILRHGMTEFSSNNFLHLPGFTSDDVEKLLGVFESDNGWINEMLLFRKERDFLKWGKIIQHFSQVLWEKIGASVDKRLTAFGIQPDSHVILVINGRFSLLPFHLAGTWSSPDQIFLSKYVISSIPSLAALKAAATGSFTSRKTGILNITNDKIKKNTIEVETKKNHLVDRSIFIISDPTRNLPFASVESEVISRHFSVAQITFFDDEQALPKNLSASAKSKDFIHFACHGYYNPSNPLFSGLIVAQGALLSLITIMSEWDLSDSNLVTLSACESSLIGPSRAPSECIGLVLAFLISGASRILSTLWVVDDLAAMLLMDHFYFKMSQGIPIGMSLKIAQRWLATLKVNDVKNILSNYQLLSEDNKLLNPDSKIHLAQRLHDVDESDCLFANPAYWGCFILNGI